MSKLDRFIDNKLVQNISIWCFLFVIFLFVIQADNRIVAASIFIVFVAPPVYINNLKILPLFLQRKTVLATILFFLNLLFFTFIGVWFLSDFLKRFELKLLLNVIGGMLLILIFGAALKLARDSIVRRQQANEAELKLLKAQLNPHFLFNTLNNLYGLAVIKSDKLPNLMLKLSDLLRYSLYETSTFFVPIDKEITYLQNYIALEKIRLEDKTEIKFKASNISSNRKIVPMLLIVFVENAFKHLGDLEDQFSSVTIEIKEDDDKLYFSCQNTISVNEMNNNQLEKGKSGIGLQNAQKRLSLLYPDKHKLIINKTSNLYSVNLQLL